jgi:hypothetical protein
MYVVMKIPHQEEHELCVGGCVQYQQCVHFILQRKKEGRRKTNSHDAAAAALAS